VYKVFPDVVKISSTTDRTFAILPSIYYYCTNSALTCLDILKCEVFTIRSTVKFKLRHDAHHYSEHCENGRYGRIYVQRHVITTP